MHVAHFIQRYPPALGGSEAYFARLTEHLRAAGDTVTVFTSTAIELREMLSACGRPDSSAAGVNRYRPLGFPLRRYVLKALSLLPVRRLQALTLPCNPVCPAMWRAVADFEEPLDAVHASAFPYTFPIACGLRLARRRKVPFFLTPFLHLGDAKDPNDRTRRQYTAPVMRWLLQQADGVFVQTEGEHRAVVELGVPESRIFRQGLGVAPSECTGGERLQVRKTWGIQPQECVVGHLANLSEEKGTVDLLKANIDARIVLAGPAMPNFERFWKTYPNKGRVVRLGVLSEEEKRGFYAGIDVFCLPSRSDSFGLVLLEAWANAKPVVVYRAGGPADLVRDDVDGFVTNCEPEAIRIAIKRLVDPSIRSNMGQLGRNRVLSDFRWPEKMDIVRRALLQSSSISRR
jgi:glycosyltransferase involved in cell wall biosynthesis